MKRKCSKCRKRLPVSEFHKHKNGKDGLRSRCKGCNRAEARDFYKRNPDPYKKRARAFSRKHSKRRKQLADEIKKQRGCYCCREREVCALDFHHLHGNSKGRDGGMPVSQAAHNSNKKLFSELAKCIVVCANCHRKIHAGLIEITSGAR